VPETGNQWVYARISVPLSQVPELSAGVLTNSKGVFHLGIIHGGASGGCRFAYFSDFATPELKVLQDSLLTCANNVVLDAGSGFINYSWSTGAASQTITVTENGLYKITVTDKEECILRDSGYVKFEKATSDSNNIMLCPGQSYKLPWGPTINVPGIYRDTLRYLSGCDSLVSTVNLKVSTVSYNNKYDTICEGNSYKLPWGPLVKTTGIYSDTLRYLSGCDSLIRKIQLTVKSATINNSNITICSGQTYTLPSGIITSAAGIYRDTLRYSSGCDSMIYILNLKVNPVYSNNTIATFCSGDSYTLPWGLNVSRSGTYYDTIRYSEGCDSLIRSATVIEKSISVNNISATICPGDTYMLPWGKNVSTAGIYSDTLRYLSGCDSFIRSVNVSVISPVRKYEKQAICDGQVYILPSGKTVKEPGAYTDTLHSIITGCDSIITSLTLNSGSPPSIKLSKSNDVSCSFAISKLVAFGGERYLWSPSASLNRADIPNPTADPEITTMYHVKVITKEGCVGEDSITIYVMKNASKDFDMPSAFTPNNDGLNDCFGVKHLGNISNLQFAIYSRWGQLIFFTKNSAECWDGTYKGEKLNPDVFVYQISGTTYCGKVYKKGTVALIR
jgi:gliding motility-associated-like protein